MQLKLTNTKHEQLIGKIRVEIQVNMLENRLNDYPMSDIKLTHEFPQASM